jgi:hypothetical protein
VPGYEPVGREFESPRARKTKPHLYGVVFVLRLLVSIRLLATSLQIEFGRKPKAWEFTLISVGEAHFRKEMYLPNRKSDFRAHTISVWFLFYLLLVRFDSFATVLQIEFANEAKVLSASGVPRSEV